MSDTIGAPAALGITPSQTVGPFLHVGMIWDDGPYVVPEGTAGAVRIVGTVYDGHGVPVPDALIETWQADPHGRFAHPDDPRAPVSPTIPGFRGFGRCHTDKDGQYAVLTAKPGPVPAETGTQAPHIDVSVFGRGLLDRVVTRIYFPDETTANKLDPVLSAMPENRRHTLIAVPNGDALRFDIRLQGPDETVFFSV
ncbi:MAG TPA: protocatechuate 3,4-dioxygenase subunit alpha [Jiangellaceae bacterium]|nr:protocatechuate 3,4-dioxygenase subunit alpha [Jiangellaceae bacterium]